VIARRAPLLLASAAALLVLACSAGPQPSVRQPEGTSAGPTASPASTTPAASSSRPSPSPAPPSQTAFSTPAASFDLSLLGTPAAAPESTSKSQTTEHGVTTEDITFSRSDIPPTAAYLVHPAHSRPAAGPGIVWLHWYEPGAPTSNRTEFLGEAQALAARGVVSLLVQERFPWAEPPTSLVHDVDAVEAEVRVARAGLDLLVGRKDVDPARIALVGHDFGAMYASVLFGSDSRARALVMMAPTARWGDWFLRYWAIRDPRANYLAAMAPIDPLTWLARADGRPILLQLARGDQFVPESVAGAIAAAAGATATTDTYASDHGLNEPARVDRDAWLAAQLGLQ
jgi:dienelactone hydrolase